MSEKKIRELLDELDRELSRNEELDEETVEAVRRLDQDIDEVIRSSEQKNSPVMDDAIALEARFAATHPVAERLVRELINALGRMGI
ncbi:MAG: DUF4404 family protein [Pseudomonadota bacterium]